MHLEIKDFLSEQPGGRSRRGRRRKNINDASGSLGACG
jgi:hypothetical protein